MSTTSLGQISRVAVLARSTVFSGLSGDDLAMLAEMMHLERFAAGELVCQRGEPADAVFVVVSGTLEVLLDGASGEAPVLGAGDVFGEYGMFRHVRTSTVKATSEAVLLSLDYVRFESFLLQFPAVTLALLELTVTRMFGKPEGR